jgi:hypothetical protein
MNWGRALAVGMGVFIIFIVGMGVMMFRSNDSLKEDDYYEKGLDHDEMYERLENNKQLTSEVQALFSADGRQLEFNFPEVTPPIEAELQLLRPDDDNQDKKAKIQLLAGEGRSAAIGVASLNKGMWQIRMKWEAGGKKYYFERELYKQK